MRKLYIHRDAVGALLKRATELSPISGFFDKLLSRPSIPCLEDWNSFAKTLLECNHSTVIAIDLEKVEGRKLNIKLYKTQDTEYFYLYTYDWPEHTDQQAFELYTWLKHSFEDFELWQTTGALSDQL